jgi:zeta-carotene desaturase
MSFDVIIVGGGLSGLSAAVDLSSSGANVLLLERRPFLGGRTYSFIDRTTGNVVDNGQHLMMGCYEETRSYLRQIGAETLVELQKNLRIPFLHPSGRRAILSCPAFPAPLHILGGLMRLTSLTFRERLMLLNVGRELIHLSAESEQRLDQLTVDQWLRSLKQPESNRKYLWDIIAIGTLNDEPAAVSALLFARVLRSAFFGGRLSSSLLVPRAGLSEVLVDPAVAFVSQRGGEILTSIHVERILFDRRRAKGILCADGSIMKARTILSAVPHYSIPKLIDADDLRLLGLHDCISRFSVSPILSINVWLNKQVMEEPLAAVLDSRIQWIFNKSKLAGRAADSSDRCQYLTLVISSASEYMSMKSDEIVRLALQDLERVLPDSRSARLIHSTVLKEKRATFSPRPGMEAFRPNQSTAIGNFFLAGDWTKTGLPATIEGAVASGRRAAKEISEFLG